MVEIDGKAADM